MGRGRVHLGKRLVSPTHFFNMASRFADEQDTRRNDGSASHLRANDDDHVPPTPPLSVVMGVGGAGSVSGGGGGGERGEENDFSSSSALTYSHMNSKSSTG
jgi:hypothetical protein